MTTQFLSDYRKRLDEAMSKVDLSKVQDVITWLKQARDNDLTIFTCGNGGSASTASHFVCDLVKGASYQRPKRFRAMALTDAAPAISAYSNDVGHSVIFVEQLKNFAHKADLVIAISGSGNSPNVIEAAGYARSIGCRTVGLTGRDGGKLSRLVDVELRVPVQHMGVIEDVHLILCHMMAYYFMDTNE